MCIKKCIHQRTKQIAAPTRHRRLAPEIGAPGAPGHICFDEDRQDAGLISCDPRPKDLPKDRLPGKAGCLSHENNCYILYMLF